MEDEEEEWCRTQPGNDLECQCEGGRTGPGWMGLVTPLVGWAHPRNKEIIEIKPDMHHGRCFSPHLSIIDSVESLNNDSVCHPITVSLGSFFFPQEFLPPATRSQWQFAFAILLGSGPEIYCPQPRYAGLKGLLNSHHSRWA